MLNHPLHTKQTCGFTLLEVMIAMVVFSVGMLGLAGIQGIALQSNNTAYMRTIAMQQSYNMADILRASADFQGAIDSTFDSVSTTIGSTPTACILNSLSNTLSCSTSDMADSDIFHWQTRLAKELPSGRATISKDATTKVYTITIMWDEKHSGVTGEGCSGDSNTDLKCYKLDVQV